MVEPLLPRPLWPAPGYDVADEIGDPTDWSLNPDAALPRVRS
jgi:hypothetical protein